MQWELIIYDEDNCNHYVDMKVFNDPKEISDMLKKYEGYWCRIIDLMTLDILIEGTFDDSCLDEGYYRQDEVAEDNKKDLEEKWKSIVKSVPTWALCCEIGVDDGTVFVLDLTTEENFKVASEYLKSFGAKFNSIDNYAHTREKVIMEIDHSLNPSWYEIYGNIDEFYHRARAVLETYMKTIMEKPKDQPMNYIVIDYYMEAHNFLSCDKQKVKHFIDAENRMRRGGYKFVGGYMTRTKLCLITGYGFLEEYSRTFLGIQENFR